MPGPTLCKAEWRSCLQALTDPNPFPVWVVASGSLPPGVPVNFYAHLADLCGERGAKLVLDAAGPPLAAAMAEGVNLVKPKLRELSELVGEPLGARPPGVQRRKAWLTGAWPKWCSHWATWARCLLPARASGVPIRCQCRAVADSVVFTSPARLSR